jgi:hypothetical protein
MCCGENSTVKSFIICTHHQILLEWSSREGWEEQGMSHEVEQRGGHTESFSEQKSSVPIILGWHNESHDNHTLSCKENQPKAPIRNSNYNHTLSCKENQPKAPIRNSNCNKKNSSN